jgi:signal transduction histidine kinase/GAF domain-containing protein
MFSRNQESNEKSTFHRSLPDKVSRLAAAVSSSLSLDAVLETAVQIAQDLTGAQICRVHLIDDRGRALHLRASRGSTPKQDERLTALPLRESFVGRAFASGQLLLTGENVEIECAFGGDQTLKTLACVPLLSRGERHGVMTLGFTQHRRFDADEKALLTAIGHQVGVAVEHARLFEQQERQCRIARTLGQVAAVINSSLDLEEVLDRVLGELERIVAYDSAAIMLLAHGAARTVAERGFDGQDPPPRQIPLEEMPIGRRVVRQREPVIVSDIHQDPHLVPQMPGFGRTRCVIGVPLISHDQVIGLLYLDSETPAYYTAQDAEIANQFAQQAAIAIENARLMDEIRRRARQQQALLNIFPKISGELHLETLLQRIVEEAVAVIPGAQRGSIMVRTEEGFRFMGGVGYDLDELKKIVLRPEHLAPGDHLRRQVTCIRDIDSWAQEAGARPVRGSFEACRDDAPIRATLSAPILVEEQVFGYLNLDNLETPDAFGPLAYEAVELFAAQTAVAIVNARLHGELEDKVRRRTQEICRQRDRTEAILQSVADGVVVTDKSGQIILVNPTARAWLYPEGREEQAANQPLISFIRYQATRPQPGEPETIEFPAWQQTLKEPCWRLTNCPQTDCPAHGRDTLCWRVAGAYCHQIPTLAASEERFNPAECPVRKKLEMVSLQAHTAKWREGRKTQGRVIALRDVSRQRKLEQLQSQFVSTVSHELRTPLTNIKLYHSLLKRSATQEKHEHYMAVMDREIGRLGRLIQDILDLSRLERGETPPHREVVDVNALVQEQVEIQAVQAQNKGLALHLEPMPDDLQILGDRNRVIQVITNLLSNALNYTPAGGDIWLTTGTWHRCNGQWKTSGPVPRPDPSAPQPPGRGWAVISVRDTGVGIPYKDQPHIFDRFYRGEQANLGTPGTGLGLAIVREILDLHEGEILLESAPGRGSTFTVLLPLPEPEKKGAPTVLVADDEEQIGKLIHRFLSREGIQARWVSDGQQALEAIAAEQPDLLILDLAMPVLNGYQVMEQLRARGDMPSLPVLVLSSWTEDKFQRVKELGADDFLNKPFSGAVLMDVVRRLIEPPGKPE